MVPDIRLHIANAIDDFDDEVASAVEALMLRADWLAELDLELSVTVAKGGTDLNDALASTRYCLLVGGHLPDEARAEFDAVWDAYKESGRPFVTVCFLDLPEHEVDADVKALTERLLAESHQGQVRFITPKGLELGLVSALYGTALTLVTELADKDPKRWRPRQADLLRRRAAFFEATMRLQAALATDEEAAAIYGELVGDAKLRVARGYADRASRCSARAERLERKLQAGARCYLPLPVYHVSSTRTDVFPVGIDVRIYRRLAAGRETLYVEWSDTHVTHGMEAREIRYANGVLRFLRHTDGDDEVFTFTPMTLDIYDADVRDGVPGTPELDVEEELVEMFLDLEDAPAGSK